MRNRAGEIIGDYEIIDLIASGGVADVYRAHSHGAPGADVALKIIRLEMAKVYHLTERFTREAQVMMQLKHPHILPVYHYGEHEHNLYMVMKLVEGGSLAALGESGPPPLATVNLILEQIASALDYAHEQGVIHRDIKPQNILIDQSNAYLSDFGMVKSIFDTSNLTRRGTILGTPAYMSPEQCRSPAVDKRSDIYSLGVVLFELLTGKLPFDSNLSAGVMHMHMFVEPPTAASIRPEIPDEICAVVNKALAKEPDARYQTAGEMAAAFKAVLPPEPATANGNGQESPATLVGIKRPDLPQARATPSMVKPPPMIILVAIVAVIIIIAAMVVILLNSGAA
jgi:serine/threonine-protein kinase